mgnify:CR=1 FL=1
MRKISDRFMVYPVIEMANNNFNERAVDVERSNLEGDRKMSFAQWTRLELLINFVPFFVSNVT